MGVIVFITFLSLTVVGIGAGAIKAGSGMSTYSRSPHQVLDATPEDIGRIQVESRQGMIDTVVGTAEAAMSAQTAAAPGVARNPVGLGFSEGMTLGQEITRYSQGRANAIGHSSATQTPEIRQQPKTDGSASGTGSSNPAGLSIAEAPDDYFVAWYADNIGFNPIRISSTHGFNMYEKAADYPGGGHNRTIELQKVALTGAYRTRAEALAAVQGMMTDKRVMKGVYAGQHVATINGETHNLEYIGILDWWE